MENKIATCSNPFDVFVTGARKGFHIAIHNGNSSADNIAFDRQTAVYGLRQNVNDCAF